MLSPSEAAGRKERVISNWLSMTCFSACIGLVLGLQPAEFLNLKMKLLSSSLFVAINLLALEQNSTRNDQPYRHTIRSYGLIPFCVALGIATYALHNYGMCVHVGGLAWIHYSFFKDGGHPDEFRPCLGRRHSGD